jgi:erythromycin esterase-like protein
MSVLDRLIRPLAHRGHDYDALLDMIGDARFVLLGEASHGTHEFYAERAEITRRLIVEKGFDAVSAEADWPDALRVHRYVHGKSADASANEALAGFRRFPTWMWRNTVMLDFVAWLRGHNLSGARPAGFYGLDLYSLSSSIEAVLKYLERVDPAAAGRARYRYSCFEDFGEDAQAYGYAAGFDLDRSCESQVVAQLLELRRTAAASDAGEEHFYAEQNARLVKNAEEYYRTMFRGRVSSWNLRDSHMAETLEVLTRHLGARGRAPKIVVWAHNSHLGDARATQMGDEGEWNLGQLVREKSPGEAFLVGFTTYTGTVTAASSWDGEAEVKRVRPALEESYEALFHRAGVARFLLDLRDAPAEVAKARLERAIGVIYRPESERVSHYFRAELARQFDAVLHFDETTAVRALDRLPLHERGEAPETFPSGV